MKTTTPRPIRLKDYQPPSHLIDKTDLVFELAPDTTIVTAKLKVRPNPDAPATKTLILNGEHLKLLSLKRDGKALKDDGYTITSDALTITDCPDGPFKIEIKTEINPETNKALQGLYRTNSIYCTQCEAEGFRRMTYYLDRPDVLSVYSCKIIADVDEAPVLLSNGNMRERGTLDGGQRHYAVWHDPHPKPSYLFALVAGDLRSIASEFTTQSGRRVDLAIYVEPGKEDRCAWAMDSLKRAMAWDEQRFGREYDLDVFNIVAVADFNMGAMENKGLNIFNDRLILASPETATDANYMAIESVIAHEYFHNWTGNRITCRDWFQLCLKEGLTVFRDQEFSAEQHDPAVQRISDVRRLRMHQFPEDAGPLAHPVRPSEYIEINNFYTATVYEKGAELVRMIQTLLGPDRFRKGMDLYFERHDGEAATIEQFVACFEEAGDRSLASFMTWYEQPGTPSVTVRSSYNKTRGQLELVCKLAMPNGPRPGRKKLPPVPIKLGLIAANGEELPLTLDRAGPVHDGIITLTKAEQTFRFKNVTSKPVASLLRGFSAPVRLTSDATEKQLGFLMAHDNDPFARWQAVSNYALRILTAQVRHGNDPAPLARRIDSFADALSHAIADESLNDAYRAELLRLPSEADVAREIARNIDPSAIHVARRTVIAALAKRLGATLGDICDARRTDDAYAPTADQIGRRALKNAAISMLMHRNAKADRTRLEDHYWSATNMTDQAHALMLYAHGNSRARGKVLEHFHDQWQQDHLVIDTWFAVQATAPANPTLARVKKLLRHPRYSATTPNKIRAVIGNFAANNPVQFNRPDGAGYRFVADQVLKIDRFNPQVAARMLGAFRSWRMLEPQRRKLAREALKGIVGSPKLSRDVYEIAARVLGD